MALKFNPKHRPNFLPPKLPEIQWHPIETGPIDNNTSIWEVSWGMQETVFDFSFSARVRMKMEDIWTRVSGAWFVLTGAKRAMSDAEIDELVEDC